MTDKVWIGFAKHSQYLLMKNFLFDIIVFHILSLKKIKIALDLNILLKVLLVLVLIKTNY